VVDCGQKPSRIIQILSCEPGWRATFRVNKDVHSAPIVCWLLVDHDGDRHIHPAALMAGQITDVTLAGNYLGVVEPAPLKARKSSKRRHRTSAIYRPPRKR
jgi:hypothetical protein